jgi:hypothetical protein
LRLPSSCVQEICVFPHCKGAPCEGKFSTVDTTLCSPHSVNKGFGPSVCPTQNTQSYESNEFVLEGRPLSAEKTSHCRERKSILHVASSVPTRWRLCITNEPAGPIQPRSGPSGGARESKRLGKPFQRPSGFLRTVTQGYKLQFAINLRISTAFSLLTQKKTPHTF